MNAKRLSEAKVSEPVERPTDIVTMLRQAHQPAQLNN